MSFTEGTWAKQVNSGQDISGIAYVQLRLHAGKLAYSTTLNKVCRVPKLSSSTHIDEVSVLMFQGTQELKGALKLEFKWALFCVLHNSLVLILYTFICNGLLINFNIILLDTASGRGFTSNYTLPTVSFLVQRFTLALSEPIKVSRIFSRFFYTWRPKQIQLPKRRIILNANKTVDNVQQKNRTIMYWPWCLFNSD
jgi:hypothetical protein